MFHNFITFLFTNLSPSLSHSSSFFFLPHSLFFSLSFSPPSQNLTHFFFITSTDLKVGVKIPFSSSLHFFVFSLRVSYTSFFSLFPTLPSLPHTLFHSLSLSLSDSSFLVEQRLRMTCPFYSCYNCFGLSSPSLFFSPSNSLLSPLSPIRGERERKKESCTLLILALSVVL